MAEELSIPNAWEVLSDERRAQVEGHSRRYMNFLKENPSVFQRLKWIKSRALENGFIEAQLGVDTEGQTGQEKLIYTQLDSAVALVVPGTEPIRSTRIISVHVDTPRLDFTVRPFVSSAKSGLCLAATQSYGGIKNYQWASLPLRLVGYARGAAGEETLFDTGADGPCVVIPDLLPHLQAVQRARKCRAVLKPSELKVAVAALPSSDAPGGAGGAAVGFKRQLLRVLEEATGLTEEDVQVAKFSLFPALPPRFVGIDKALIGAPGQDNGATVFAAAEALLGLRARPKHTSVVFFVDKEETGSWGAASGASRWLEMVLHDAVSRISGRESLRQTHGVCANSLAVAADTDGAANPIFRGAYDAQNNARVGRGVTVSICAGNTGKAEASEASAAFAAKCMAFLKADAVPFQFCTFGKLGYGGGGTVSTFTSNNIGCDTIDMGPSILSMHSPFELAHCADIYATYLAYAAFLCSD
eukprot:gnl/Chilomastix_cuspidata/1580.p1 GENE.gnl/Chilomastix_cuspidata/1580~~gnl/Chilomastix_cuspidata/1580.p1  ORF type:complete len:471 (-),score=199.99 gnl/Chilomastix_cuspidata/1580:766-2178(-)